MIILNKKYLLIIFLKFMLRRVRRQMLDRCLTEFYFFIKRKNVTALSLRLKNYFDLISYYTYYLPYTKALCSLHYTYIRLAGWFVIELRLTVHLWDLGLQGKCSSWGSLKSILTEFSRKPRKLQNG